jgi:hypothetical protein
LAGSNQVLFIWFSRPEWGQPSPAVTPTTPHFSRQKTIPGGSLKKPDRDTSGRDWSRENNSGLPLYPPKFFYFSLVLFTNCSVVIPDPATFFLTINFTKWNFFVIFLKVKKKIFWANWLSSLKSRGLDLGSEIGTWKKLIPDRIQGSKKAPIPDPDQHC